MNIRSIIKKEMYRLGAERYRITASNEVHFYGVMPNSHRRGWYLKHYDAADYADQILSDIALSNDMIAFNLTENEEPLNLLERLKP
jgi:hypothetical protein